MNVVTTFLNTLSFPVHVPDLKKKRLLHSLETVTRRRQKLVKVCRPTIPIERAKWETIQETRV